MTGAYINNMGVDDLKLHIMNFTCFSAESQVFDLLELIESKSGCWKIARCRLIGGVRVTIKKNSHRDEGPFQIFEANGPMIWIAVARCVLKFLVLSE